MMIRLISASIVLVSAGLLHGQVNKKTTDYGIPYSIKPGTPEGSYRLSGIDNVSPFSGKLSVAIPIHEIGARGEARYTVMVNATLPSWNYELELLSSPCDPGTPNVEPNSYIYKNKATALWWTGHRARYGPGMVVYRRSGWDEVRDTNNNGTDPYGELYFTYTTNHVVFLTPDGNEVVLYDNRPIQEFTQTNSTYQGGGIQRRFFSARDGSGITFEATTVADDIAKVSSFSSNEVTLAFGFLRFPNGVKYQVNFGRVDYIEDRNGNQLTLEYDVLTNSEDANAALSTFRIKKATDSIGRVTTFSYGENIVVDGVASTGDVIRFQGSGGDQRQIVIERKAVVDALAPGETASAALFPGIPEPGGTNTIFSKVPRSIVLPNLRRYRILYNNYGEIASLELPSGGRFEYTHGPGFNFDSSKGSHVGGRMLDPYRVPTNVAFGNCILRPMGKPIWQPFIYRRLLEKRTYLGTGGSWISKSNFYSNESIQSVSTHSVPGLDTRIMRMSIRYGGGITIREESAVAASGSSNLRWRRHSYVGSNPAGGCGNENGGWLGPAESLQCDKGAPPTVSANPRTEDGKEFRTEWGSDAGGNNMNVMRRSETNFIKVADGSHQPCWQKDTELDGGLKSKRRVLFYDRTNTQALPAGATDNQPMVTTNYYWKSDSSGNPPAEPVDARHYYSNLSDTFEFDWDQGPNYDGSQNAVGTCPLMNSPVLAGHLRRTHQENWAARSGASQWRHWEAQFGRLTAENTVYAGNGLTVSQSHLEYDGNLLEGSPSGAFMADVGTRKRGNPTKERIVKSTGNEMVTETWFDANGQRNRVRDAGGNEARYGYFNDYSVGGLPGGTNGFLSMLILPVAQAGETAMVETWKVDPYLGVPTDHSARNGAQTRYSWSDALGRLKSIDRTPFGSGTRQKSSFEYGDTSLPLTVSTSGARLDAEDGQVKSHACYDGLGREYKTVSRISSGVFEITEKEFTGFSELMRVSNPYRLNAGADPSGSALCGLVGTGLAWNVSLYDNLGRVKQEQAAGQAVTNYTYTPDATTISDPAGKAWRREVDGLGRLVRVFEEAHAGGANEATLYTYDAADRLTQVTQGAQTRLFSYNWAGQLLSAQNPESGTTSYQYDAEGNLIAKLDARGAGGCAGNWNGGVCDGTGVDGLGRVVKRTYLTGGGAPTLASVYCFDGKKPMRLSGPDRVECAGSVAGNERGHLTGAGNLLSRTEYEHDLAGRVTRVIQKTEGSPATNGERAVEYQYWASDRVKETKLTSGRRVAECIDARLRVVWASGVRPWGDCGAGTEPAFGDAYVRGAEYAPFGALARWQLGNGLWEVSEFNARMQMVRKRMGNTANAQGCAVSGDDALCLEWGYGPEGSNNGNLIEARQWAPKTAGGYLQLQSGYSYDGRNRLLAFQENVVGGGSGGGSWGQTSAYDRYGNRWAVSWGVAQSQGTPNQQGYIDVATNRVVTALVGTGTQAVSYDAAGHMIGHPHVAGALSYDAEGRRVKRIAGGVTSWYWYGADGGMVAEDTNDAVSNGVEYLSVDALGSTRLVTRGDKSVAARMDYWPFGEEVLGASSQGNRDLVGGYTGAAAVKQRFTGKERDVETGLDYFGARYMAAAQGRFTSPDAPFADQDPADPQSWNLYAYARNNPLLFVDPTGQYTCHSSVSAQECTNFQDSLTEAQKSADALKQKYGANSTQYTDAQRAIDSYGAAGVDNGVVIKVGNTGSAGAQVQVGGVAGPKTKDNPTGQQIDVTFGTGQLGKGGAANAGLSAHEGSHVADGSAWVASGFKDALNPTRYATESRAYRIQANIYEGQGYLYGTFSPTELMWFRGWPQSNVDARIDYWLRIPKAQGGLYGVIPSDKTKAFTPGARLRR